MRKHRDDASPRLIKTPAASVCPVAGTQGNLSVILGVTYFLQRAGAGWQGWEGLCGARFKMHGL